ncbi:armadillo-type protein [Mycena crocata]|nr:armadillo-type protein [Mycena crocata]
MLILRDLARRAESEAEARTMVEESVHWVLAHLLRSPNIGIVEAACMIFGSLAAWKDGNAAIVKLNPCQQLLLLSSHKDPRVRKQAICVLSLVGRSAEGAHTLVEANAWLVAVRMIQSKDTEILVWTCQMVADIWRHTETLHGSAVESGLCSQLVDLVEYSQPAVQNEALYALSCITDGSVPGVYAVVVSSDLGWSMKLLYSPDPSIRIFTCQVLANIARQDALIAWVVDLFPGTRLISLLDHVNDSVQSAAAYALSQLCRAPDGSRDVTAILSDGLSGSDSLILQTTCQSLRKMIHDERLTEAITNSPCLSKLISLLESSDYAVQRETRSTLDDIFNSAVGGPSIIKILKDTVAILQTTDRDAVMSKKLTACRILGNLGQVESLRTIIVDLAPYTQLVALLMDRDSAVRNEAIYALYHALDCHGEYTAANVLGELLHVDHSHIAGLACHVVRKLTQDRNVHQEIVDATCCPGLLSLAQNPLHQKTSLRTIQNLSTSEAGARGLINANAIQCLTGIVQSKDLLVSLTIACRTLHNLALHGQINSTDIQIIVRIISLLRSEDSPSRSEALHALVSSLSCDNQYTIHLLSDESRALLGNISKQLEEERMTGPGIRRGNLSCNRSRRSIAFFEAAHTLHRLTDSLTVYERPNS